MRMLCWGLEPLDLWVGSGCGTVDLRSSLWSAKTVILGM